MRKIADILADKTKKTNKTRSRGYQYYQKDSFDFFQLVQRWEHIVGHKLAQMTSPLKIRHGTLYLATSPEIYIDHLHFLSEEIRKKIIITFPQLKLYIKRIKYFQSTQLFTEEKNNIDNPFVKTIQQRMDHPHSPQHILARQKAMQEFEHISDPELKELFISLYIQGMKDAEDTTK